MKRSLPINWRDCYLGMALQLSSMQKPYKLISFGRVWLRTTISTTTLSFESSFLFLLDRSLHRSHFYRCFCSTFVLGIVNYCSWVLLTNKSIPFFGPPQSDRHRSRAILHWLQQMCAHSAHRYYLRNDCGFSHHTNCHETSNIETARATHTEWKIISFNFRDIFFRRCELFENAKLNYIIHLTILTAASSSFQIPTIAKNNFLILFLKICDGLLRMRAVKLSHRPISGQISSFFDYSFVYLFTGHVATIADAVAATAHIDACQSRRCFLATVFGNAGQMGPRRERAVNPH